VSRARRVDLGVDWHVPGRKRRIATTTPATSHLIAMLAGDGLTWRQIGDAIRYDTDARAVADLYVEAGHGDQVPVVS